MWKGHWFSLEPDKYYQLILAYCRYIYAGVWVVWNVADAHVVVRHSISHTLPVLSWTHFRTALILLGIDSRRCFKIPLGFSFLASHICCKFIASMMQVSCYITSLRYSISLRSVDFIPLLHQLHPKPLSQDGFMFPWFLHRILTLPSECQSRNWNSWDQASSVQYWWVPLNVASVSFSSLTDANSREPLPVWSSAAVAHLFQGVMCCMFRDALLHPITWLF